MINIKLLIIHCLMTIKIYHSQESSHNHMKEIPFIEKEIILKPVIPININYINQPVKSIIYYEINIQKAINNPIINTEKYDK